MHFESFFSITCSIQTFIGKLSLRWPPCCEVARPSSVHGSRASRSQKKDNSLPASSLLAFCGCKAKLFQPFPVTFQRPHQFCSFTPVYLILTCFWDWLEFRNNTESKSLKELFYIAVHTACPWTVGEAPALLDLITPLWSWASPQYHSHTVTSTDSNRQPQLPTELTMGWTQYCFQQ